MDTTDATTTAPLALSLPSPPPLHHCPRHDLPSVLSVVESGHLHRPRSQPLLSCFFESMEMSGTHGSSEGGVHIRTAESTNSSTTVVQTPQHDAKLASKRKTVAKQ